MTKERKHLSLLDCQAALKLIRAKGTPETRFKALKAKGYTNTVKELPRPSYLKFLEARLSRRVGEKPKGAK